MSGPRVTSGKGSKQDYQSPRNLLDACEKRFGPIIFDLAAHRLNKVHERYFAPKYFTDLWDPDKMDAMELVRSLVARGAHEDEAYTTVYTPGPKAKLRVKNYDPDAYGLDAFGWSWSLLHRDLHKKYGPGNLWINCEFNDVPPWSAKCRLEAAAKGWGCHILLLTPMVITDWYVQNIAGHADVYQLANRVSFDGKHPFPKDCMISHFHPKATGKLSIWDWKKDVILERWHLG